MAALLEQVRRRPSARSPTGDPVRAGRRGGAAAAQPQPQPALPGHASLNNTARPAARMRWSCPGCAGAGEAGREPAQFDLSLSLGGAGRASRGALKYATRLFDRATVERWADHFVRLLEAMVAERRPAVDALPLLSAAERQQLLREFNASELRTRRTAHSRAVRAAGGASARCGGGRLRDESLTYARAHARANQLAHELIGLGVRPDDRVAICVERSSSMVVGLLGILKAGGAYVPLDPAIRASAWPRCSTTARRWPLLTQSRARGAVPETELPVLRLDRRSCRCWRGACRRATLPCAGCTPPSRLRDLHLRLDRHAQGRDGRASLRQPAGASNNRISTPRPRRLFRALRRSGFDAATGRSGAAAQRRAAAGGAGAGGHASRPELNCELHARRCHGAVAAPSALFNQYAGQPARRLRPTAVSAGRRRCPRSETIRQLLSARAVRARASTGTARPKRRRLPARTTFATCRDEARSIPIWAGRSPTRRSTSSTRAASRCRSA